jgi:glucan phosphoethanolaminetransferase (alkaline phosphatase superfamily)
VVLQQHDGDNIAYREQIGAEPRNRGKNVDDMLLVDEMSQSLKNHPQGKHLIILHTKGSHFNYTSATAQLCEVAAGVRGR